MFTGAITALITPFTSDGTPDTEALTRFVKWQIEQGIQGLVPCGSTGEAITLTPDERRTVIETVVKAADGAVPVIAGTGSSSTAMMLEFSKQAVESGADGILLNAPAYNKPQQQGLYEYFASAAEAFPKTPIMLYNIPGRTAITMSTDICVRLDREYENVNSYKDATGDLGQTEELLRLSNLTMLSGDDGLTLPMMALGAKGIVSVASNVVPAAISQLANAMAAGDLETARELNHRLTPVFRACFFESNPVPSKYGASLLGFGRPDVRPPLAKISDEGAKAMESALRNFGAL